MNIIRYFRWTWLPIVLVATYVFWGVPHISWEYSFHHNGNPYDPFAYRHYTRCTYLNPWHSVTIYPHDGKCPLIRFFHQSSDGSD